jgi:K+-transporting ATPase ATPase C chain
MLAHLRANLLLLALTLLICCVLYPLTLWLIGQTMIPTTANGSLVDKNGNPTNDPKEAVGSRLIAQGFSKDEYFQPRPSAAGDDGYAADASGGSNLAVSNPKLRGRVAQTLGPIARYRKDGPWKGAAVGDDIETWFAEQSKKRDLVKEWVDNNPSLVEMWAGSSSRIKEYLKDTVLPHWQKEHQGAADPDAKELAVYFFKNHRKTNPGKWPKIIEDERDGMKIKVDGKTVKKIEPVDKGDEIKAYFFDQWLREKPKKLNPLTNEMQAINPLTDMEQVPADLVMTSGSGLDPHISKRNAEYQMDRVIEAREKQVKESGGDPSKVQAVVEELVNKRAFRPLAGLAGGDALLNVLELNLALDAALKPLTGQGSR